MDVLLTGATGFVGRHVAERLRLEGVRVRCLVRPATDPRPLEEAGFPVVRGHLRDRAALEAAAAGADAVVHVAGLIAARSHTEMLAVNAAGAARLAAACGAAALPPRRFLLVSSLAAAGPSRAGGAVRETDPPRPVSRYGLTKLLGERAVARALPERTALTIVRPPAVYGPHDRGILPFFQAAAAGLRPRVGLAHRRLSLVPGADLADGIVRALLHEGAAGRTYHVADPRPVSLHEVLGMIEAAVGSRARAVVLPEAVVRAAAVVAEELARLFGEVPRFSRDKAAEFLAEGWVCDPARAMSELGWAPTRTHAEGLRETADWYRAQGWIGGRAR